MKKLFFLPILLLLLCPNRAQGQVTFDGAVVVNCHNGGGSNCTTDGASMTFSHATGSGSNRQMAAFVSLVCSAGTTVPVVTGVTYHAIALSQTIHNAPASVPRAADLWIMPAGTMPDTGSNNVIVNFNNLSTCNGGGGIGYANFGVITLAGVNQTTPFTSLASGSSNSATSASATLSSSGGSDLDVFAACGGTDFSASPVTGTARGARSDLTNSCASFAQATAVGGTTALQWNFTSGSDSSVMVGAAMKAASGTTVSPSLTLLGVGEIIEQYFHNRLREYFWK